MTIEPLLPVWLVVLLSVACWILFIIIEWRRNLRYRPLRLLSSTILIGSLVLMLLRPGFIRISDHEAIVLTSGYIPTVVDSLARANGDASIVQLEGTRYRKARKINSYRQLLAGYVGADGARPGQVTAIAGDGLPVYALDSLSGGFSFFPSRAPEGITAISFPETIQRDKQAIISGAYRLNKVPGTLYFAGPAGRLDSLTVTAPTGNFSFDFMARTSGRITYTLSLVDSAGKSIEETLPLVVDAFQPLTILMLQGYPTFEMQQLKNYLSDRGHRVAMRAQLSRNIYRTEFANRESISLNRLTTPLLEEIDLLVVDPAAMSELSSAERSLTESAVRAGLGLLFAFNGASTRLPAKELLPVLFSPAADTASVVVRGKRLTLPAARLTPRTFTRNGIVRSASRILSGTSALRKGAVGFQLLQETYSLLLAGDSLSYGAIWTPLIDATARAQPSVAPIHTVDALPAYTNQPVSIEILSASAPRLFADSVQIPLREDPLTDGLWHATVWADATGWHNLRTDTDTTSAYVFAPDAWRALRITQQHRAHALASMKESIVKKGFPIAEPWPPWIFWAAFLLAAGCLWLVPKL